MSDEAASNPHRESAFADGMFPTASGTATQVALMLGENNMSAADRLVSELFRHVTACSGDIPPHVLDEPGSTGDLRYDTLLAVGLAYALTMRGIAPRTWMEAVPALPQEWLWDGDEDSSPEYREYIRRQTPAMLLAKGLLLRERDIGRPTTAEGLDRRPPMNREDRLHATPEALRSVVIDEQQPMRAAVHGAQASIPGMRNLQELIDKGHRRMTGAHEGESMTEAKPSPWAEIVGPCYTVTSMARTLGWTEGDVVEAGNDLRLLMLTTDDGLAVFPSFQLQDGRIVEGLQEVLRVLETGTAGRWTWAQWLNVALPDQEPPRNITLLYDGLLEEALQDARYVAAAWSS